MTQWHPESGDPGLAESKCSASREVAENKGVWDLVSKGPMCWSAKDYLLKNRNWLESNEFLCLAWGGGWEGKSWITTSACQTTFVDNECPKCAPQGHMRSSSYGDCRGRRAPVSLWLRE
jgi:hypothetical protein